MVGARTRRVPCVRDAEGGIVCNAVLPCLLSTVLNHWSDMFQWLKTRHDDEESASSTGVKTSITGSKEGWTLWYALPRAAAASSTRMFDVYSYHAWAGQHHRQRDWHCHVAACSRQQSQWPATRSNFDPTRSSRLAGDTQFWNLQRQDSSGTFFIYCHRYFD